MENDHVYSSWEFLGRLWYDFFYSTKQYFKWWYGRCSRGSSTVVSYRYGVDDQCFDRWTLWCRCHFFRQTLCDAFLDFDDLLSCFYFTIESICEYVTTLYIYYACVFSFNLFWVIAWCWIGFGLSSGCEYRWYGCTGTDLA